MDTETSASGMGRGSSSQRARLIHVRLPEAVHRALRIQVATQDTSIQEWVASLITREVDALVSESAVVATRRR
jgi:predicted HicB family RNase H-like nuclease